MPKQLLKYLLLLLTSFIALPVHAQVGIEMDNVMGETLEISTHLNSYVGKPIWLLIVRDLDNGMNIPYLFDITDHHNVWLAFTFGHHYLILASELTIVKYQPRYNTYKKYVIKDFCQLQSNGRIHRGKSMSINIIGRLSPNTNTYRCNVATFPEGNFTIVEP